MQIVIPMSGAGSRFIAAGYTDPKPLIKVHGKPIIEWVLKLFPGETDITFICRQDHLDTTAMRDILTQLAPQGKILGIQPHKKGPVYAVSQAVAGLNQDEPVLISYCDYYMQWDYPAFKREVLARHCAGAIPCYTGFHPNLIPQKNVYASCKVDTDSHLLEIREKHSFEADKTKSLHSPGMYYFQSAALVGHYFNQMMASADWALNGEYYVSLVYNLMVQDQLSIWVPANVPKFCQWGTPEDLQDYLFWVNTVKGFVR